MIMTLMMTLSTIINWSIAMMTHPLAITLMIIAQTMILCLMMGSLSYSFWFSYILFLIFLGGMLVLFIYMTSLASNEMFSIPIVMISLMTLMLLPCMITLSKKDHFLMFPTIKQDTILKMIPNMSSELPQNLSQLYNLPSTTITSMMITYLLITLIIIVKITQVYEGPLRQTP